MTDIIPGTTFGAWTVLRTEGRAAWVLCRCNNTRLVALAALESGESQSCDCVNTSSTRQPLRRSSFANEIAGAEARGGRKRHFGGGVS
jgi:hypothetical protein